MLAWWVRLTAGFQRSLCSLGMTRKKWNIPLANRGCKIAVLCKNRRCGNCNAHKCALPRATLGFCTSTAQRICTIISSTDKNSCHNFVKLSACWLAYARYFCCGNCNAHKCALPRATLGFCTSTAQRICTISSSTDKNSCHNFVKLSACWLAYAHCFQSLQRFLQELVSPVG